MAKYASLFANWNGPESQWQPEGDREYSVLIDTTSVLGDAGKLIAIARQWRKHQEASLIAFRWITPPRRLSLAARCVLLSFQDGKALCKAEVASTWLRIELPAEAIRQHGLREGEKFLWWMSENGDVFDSDIDTDIPRESSLSAQEQEEVRKLYAEEMERLSKEGVWIEFKGDSP